MLENLCIGIDVGGTFTDAVLTGAGEVIRAKALTTHGDPGRGVIAACELVAERLGVALDDLLPNVKRFGLGTTVVTNQIASRAGRRIGLITTAGFENIVPFSKLHWGSENGWLVTPPQIISRDRIIGVAERIDRRGEVITPLDETAVLAAATTLVESREVEALAVSFIWSVRNDSHEARAVRLIRERYPDLPVSSAVSLLPVVREYERTMFCLLNSYTSGALAGIDWLSEELARRGLSAPLLLIHSGGGATSVEEARQVPVSLAESGPAAGVGAAAMLAASCGVSEAITCDMGGTTFDFSVLSRGEPARRVRGDLMGIWTALRSVDVDSIGAGGGSIATINAFGALQVGPRSAGSMPGPACYGRGGTEATVTDALLVLGLLDEDTFLGGTMRLDREAAVGACAKLGEKLGLEPEAVALGIREVALAGMIAAVRGRLAKLGIDPRGKSIVSYGGCGSLFTPEIAAAIGASEVLISRNASVLSATGAATLDVRRERPRSVNATMPVDTGVLVNLLTELMTEIDGDLERDGIPVDEREYQLEGELRFNRQKWELAIPFRSLKIDDTVVAQLEADFREEYISRFGSGSLMPGARPDLSTVRAIGIGRTTKAAVATSRESVERSLGRSSTANGSRNILVDEARGRQPVKVVSYDQVGRREQLCGPALIDGGDTTVFVPSTCTAQLHDNGTLIISVNG